MTCSVQALKRDSSSSGKFTGKNGTSNAALSSTGLCPGTDTLSGSFSSTVPSTLRMVTTSFQGLQVTQWHKEAVEPHQRDLQYAIHEALATGAPDPSHSAEHSRAHLSASCAVRTLEGAHTNYCNAKVPPCTQRRASRTYTAMRPRQHL